MPFSINQGNVWKPVKDAYVNQSGVWKPIRRAFVNQSGVWKQYFQDEVVATLNSTGTEVIFKSLFSLSDWNNPLLVKRVVNPVGATIGTTTLNSVVMPVAQIEGQAGNFDGQLIFDNYGTLSGLGGAANSGTGGNVIHGNWPGKSGQKMIVNNYGTLRAGGGGGGKGGTGGAGSYQTPYTYSEGPFYDGTHFARTTGETTGYYSWAGSIIFAMNYGVEYQYVGTSGGWDYYLDAFQGTFYEGPSSDREPYNVYGVRRQQTRYNTFPTTGGVGGNGGRGQGYDGGNASGIAGSAGGTNAGAGGTGGTGGGYGSSGGTGATGGAGNVSGGTAGTAGGLAGYYLFGSSNVTLNNFGSVSGRLS